MDESVGMRAYALAFLSSFMLWILLTGSLATEEIGAGLLVASVVSVVSGPHLAIFNGLRLHPLALVSLLDYLSYFFFALVRANLDMARRVLAPSLPINPGIVELETTLESSLGRMLLANSITLTPGTLTVDLKDEKLLVHWVAVPKGSDLTTATRQIAMGFEQRISGFLK
jgi:multicomponent Na+:H+ antiporter subunit E